MPERKKSALELANAMETISYAPDAVDNARMAAPLITKKNKEREEASLLDEYGLGAGMLALGGVFARAKFAPRMIGKGLLALGFHGLKRTGSRLGHGLIGGAVGGAVIAPTAYLSAKAAEKSQDDKQFSAAHFAQIAAPATASGLLGYGMYANISQSISAADRTGNKGMIKNILSPKRNIRYAKHGLGLAGKTFDHVDTSKVSKIKPGLNLSRYRRAKGLMGTQWKGRAGGLLALGLIGMEAIAPGMYLNQTLSKKENNNG